MVDALASGASVRKGVEVRILSCAPIPTRSRGDKMSRRSNLAAFLVFGAIFGSIAILDDGRGRLYGLILLLTVTMTFVVTWRRTSRQSR